MMSEVVIFWGCSMRGGYPNVSQDEIRQIVAGMKKLGIRLASEHQMAEGVLDQEDNLTAEEIHDRDYSWLLGSSAGIFEISNPSLGVGGEIADMLHLGKPVLCLYKGDERNVSAYIRGKASSRYLKSNLICRRWETVEQSLEIIRAFVEGLS